MQPSVLSERPQIPEVVEETVEVAVDGDEGTAGVGDDAIKLGARVSVADVGLGEPSVELVPRVLDDG